MKKLLTLPIFRLCLLALLFLPACSQVDVTSLSTGMNAGQAYETVNARLTEASTLAPEATQTLPEQVSTATLTPVSFKTSSAQFNLSTATSTEIPTATPACDRAAAGNPIDMTIPDDTVMEPGQSFTKIWRLQNAGTCTWGTGYSVRFFYGAQMGAADTVSLSGEVAAGQTVEIAIDMTAPNNPGTYQGNWKLSNAAGQLFGIGPNGNAPFWVRIVVKQPPSPTPTPTSTPSQTPTPTEPPTATPTPTATPAVQVSGSISLTPPIQLDLDTGTSGSSGDLAYQVDAGNFHVLTPQTAALLGVYGLSEPGPTACQAAGMSHAPIAVESLSANTYLCYQTDQGLVGWLKYASLDSASGLLTIHYHTWAAVKP